MGKRERQRRRLGVAEDHAPLAPLAAEPAPVMVAPMLAEYQYKIAFLIDTTLNALPWDDERSIIGGLRVRFVELPSQPPIAMPACLVFETGEDARVWGCEPVGPYLERGVLPPSIVKPEHRAALRGLAGLAT